MEGACTALGLARYRCYTQLRCTALGLPRYRQGGLEATLEREVGTTEQVWYAIAGKRAGRPPCYTQLRCSGAIFGLAATLEPRRT